MRVSGQILENLFWPAEGTLGVYHPFHAAGLQTQCLEGNRVAQRFQFAMELEFALLERPSQMNQESLAEVATEDLARKEERFAISSTRDPLGVAGADSPTRHYTMDMRMKMEVLTPTVKHGEEADRRTQTLRICCNR